VATFLINLFGPAGLMALGVTAIRAQIQVGGLEGSREGQAGCFGFIGNRLYQSQAGLALGIMVQGILSAYLKPPRESRLKGGSDV
jgi:hypothetical protein